MNGTIETLPSGRFRARKIDPKSGKYRSAGTYDTELEAQHALAQPFAKAGKGSTLADIWPDFEKRRRVTVRDYRTDIQRWALYVETHDIVNVPLRQLTRGMLMRWLESLKAKGLEIQTRKNTLNLMRVVLHSALDDELISANPARDIRIKRAEEGSTDEKWRVIDPDAQLRLLRSVAPEEWPAVAAMLGLGFRNSEQWRLRWEDVDMDARLVTVRYSVKGLKTKSGKIRKLPLFGLALEAFRAAEHSRKGGCEYVFPSPRTNKRRADSSNPTRWEKWTGAAGVDPAFRWYDLRHTCATSLLAGWWGPAWSLEEIRQLLGHSSVKVTERYAHLLNETLRAAGKRSDVEFHGGSESGANSRAIFGIRTRDLRFTNPRHLEGFSGLAVEDFHQRSTARDGRIKALLLEATRLSFRKGSPLAKARVHEILAESERLVSGGR